MVLTQEKRQKDGQNAQQDSQDRGPIRALSVLVSQVFHGRGASLAESQAARPVLEKQVSGFVVN